MGSKWNGSTGFIQADVPHGGCELCTETETAAVCGCESACPCAECEGGRRGRGRGCYPGGENAEGTHVFFEECDGMKEVFISGSCEAEEQPGRMLDVRCTLRDVCPGRRSALGITLSEVDENGAEHARGFRAVTVPAHSGRCHQDVQLDTVRFILPEELSLQERRHFIVRTQHHYLDASAVWNNSWGGGR